MRWSMVPVSVAAHVAVFVALLILPLTASVELPTPAPIWTTPEFIQATALPPEPSTPQPQVVRTNPAAAPTVAPPTIAPEVDAPRPGPPAPPGSIPMDGEWPFRGGPPGLNIGDPVGPPPPPREPAKKPEPIRPGGLIREPKRIVDVQPIYPQAARDARIQGLVIIETIIDERGNVTNARVLRSAPMLDQAALTAVRQWKYTPTLLNNMPVSVIMTITFNFQLGSDTP